MKRGQASCPWPGPAQHIYKPNLVCQPIGECLNQIPLFLLVDRKGLVCKCAGQAVASFIKIMLVPMKYTEELNMHKYILWGMKKAERVDLIFQINR